MSQRTRRLTKRDNARWNEALKQNGDVQLEAELADFFAKLEGWILQQPQILRIWERDRGSRRRFARGVAKFIATIPVAESTPMNRATRRQPHIRRFLKMLEEDMR